MAVAEPLTTLRMREQAAGIPAKRTGACPGPARHSADTHWAPVQGPMLFSVLGYHEPSVRVPQVSPPVLRRKHSRGRWGLPLDDQGRLCPRGAILERGGVPATIRGNIPLGEPLLPGSAAGPASLGPALWEGMNSDWDGLCGAPVVLSAWLSV